MKLRIKGNKIRFRLSKSELDYFSQFKKVEEKTEFGTSVLTYSIEQSISSEKLNAQFKDNHIALSIPTAMAEQWINSNSVGFESEQDIGNGKKIFLLVEKDFKCLDETSEDQSDNYDNPLSNLNK